MKEKISLEECERIGAEMCALIGAVGALQLWFEWDTLPTDDLISRSLITVFFSAVVLWWICKQIWTYASPSD